MSWRRALPALLRAAPERTLAVRYRTPWPTPPRDTEQIIEGVLRAAGVHGFSVSEGQWAGTVPWRTMVYGIIGRDVDERIAVLVVQAAEGWELAIDCRPDATHAAHAAGAAGVIAMAVAVWLSGGWVDGLLPGITTAIGGGLWADVTRSMALQLLERRLRRLAGDLGSALWPGVPAQILPPPTRLGR